MKPYPEFWSEMRPGDVIAFGSGSFVANPIGRSVEIGSGSNVAHVAVVERVLADGDVVLIESTASNGFSGVKRSFLSERVERHDSDIWWLPLSGAVRACFDIDRFRAFLDEQRGKRYDLAQAIASGIDWFDYVCRLSRLTSAHENFDTLFCSELIAAAFEYCGAVPRLNASEVTPIDLCQFAIYQEQCYTLKGGSIPPTGYNTVVITAGWGEVISVSLNTSPAVEDESFPVVVVQR